MTIPPGGRSYVRRNARDTAHGALARDGGVESEAHGANVNDPVRLERMEIVNDLCSRLKRCLWRYLGISPRNTPAHPDWRIGLFRVQQACGRWDPTARVVRHIPMTDATHHSLGQALHHPLSKLHNLILNVWLC